jgi:hypothetical protein
MDLLEEAPMSAGSVNISAGNGSFDNILSLGSGHIW